MRQIDPAATPFFNNAGRPRNSEAGLTVHDLSAPCTTPGAERRRFLRFCSCLAALRLTAAVLVLAAASLVLVWPAFAQDGTLWSATLNVKKLVTLYWGCQSGGANICSDSSVLSDNAFTLSGVTYEITEVAYGTRVDSPEFVFRVEPPPPENAFDALRIHVGATAFDFADAFLTSNTSRTIYSWYATLNWSVGDQIDVRIVINQPDPPTNLTAEVKAPTRVFLDWAAPNGNASGLTGYHIEASDDGNAPWTSLVNLTNPNRTYWPVTYGSNFNDNTITPGATRHYRVRAFNGGGESANTDVVSRTTPTLVPQDAGPLEYGRTNWRLDSFRDQKVFTADLEAGFEYRFAVGGVAAYHRVEVTGPDGTKIENFVLDVNSDDNLVPRITAQQTGEHRIAISKAGSSPDYPYWAPFTERDGLKVGGMRIVFLPVTGDEPWNMPVTVGTRLRAVLGSYR